MPRLTQTRAEQAKRPADKNEAFLFCSDVKGFGVRVTKGGKRTWIVQSGTKLRRQTLGDIALLHCEDTPDGQGARSQAITMLAAAKAGKDPVLALTKKAKPNGITLNEVWALYGAAGYPMLRGTGLKEPSTVTADRNRWASWVEKSLGKKLVAEIDEKAVLRWMDTIPTEGQRSHALTLVKSILKWSGSRGHAEPHLISAKASKSREVQNFYTAAEVKALLVACDELIAENPHRLFVFSAIKLSIFCGGRTGSEVFSAEWRRIKDGVLYVPRPKEDKPKDILLSPEAVAMLDGLPRINRWVFPADSARGHLTTIQKSWPEVCERAGVERYRPHDMRHTHVATAIREGVSLYVAGQLIGHRQASTTQRYAHLEHDAKRAAVDRIAAAIAPATIPLAKAG